MIDYINKDVNVMIDELKNIEKQIQDMQCIFHPLYAIDGKLSIEKIIQLKAQKKEIILNLDRNIFTDIVKVVRQGTLNSEDELRKIALLVTWSGIHGIGIMPYDAIAENACKCQNSTEANAEMRCFDFVFRRIEWTTWLDVALHERNIITPTITEDFALDDGEVDFHTESLDYLCHYAAMIHLVRVARSGITWTAQIKEFFQWYLDNSIVCQYVLVYVILYYAKLLR